MVGSAKATNARLESTKPNKIDSTGIKRAVIVTCKASVSQSTATNASSAKALFGAGSKGKKNHIKNKNHRIAIIFSLLSVVVYLLRHNHP